MLQSSGSTRVRHDLLTEQKPQENMKTVLSFGVDGAHGPCFRINQRQCFLSKEKRRRIKGKDLRMS